MLRGYRGVILAIAGLILAVHGQPISSNAGSKTATAQGNQSTAKDANIAAGVGRIGSALETENAETDPYEKDRNKREVRDLMAQEKSAYWAEMMFWATAVAVILSVIGIMLIYITFRETRRSADVAERSLILTQRALIFARPTTSVFKQLGSGEPIGLSVSMQIQNFGNTEAVNVALIFGACIGENELPEHFDYSDGVPIARSSVLPRTDPSFFGEFGVGTDVWESVRSKQTYVFVFGSIEYGDILTNDRHHIDYCYKIRIIGDLRDPKSDIKSETYGSHNRVYDIKKRN